ncbi:jacalin-related lectin 3-like [Papaver somniferum]|uniref:jacalin-related lectin 3-like n=1 Tax=Papaver somniferum TaxID=3469 RepID=UPI000E6F4F05|nr:jacalin-related lectin 3-like [Papaver somniferum]
MNYDHGFDTIPVSAGPWGGQGGGRWDDGVHTGIKQLIVTHGAGVDSIQIEYDDKGNSVWSPKHGGNGGEKLDRIILKHPDEFLISISGYYGSATSLYGPVFIRSLTFVSNMKTYGPFGSNQLGTHFSFSMSNSKIVGFHGYFGWYLDAIGVHMRQLFVYQEPIPCKSIVPSHNLVATGTETGSNNLGFKVVQWKVDDEDGYVNNVRALQQSDSKNNSVLSLQQSDSKNNNVFALQKSDNKNNNVLALQQSDSKNNVKPNKVLIRNLSSSEASEGAPNDIKVVPTYTEKGVSSVLTYGPWGGNGGTIFDDRVYTGVRQVNLTRSSVLVSIKVLYDKNGLAVWGSRNGGAGGIKSYNIVFDFPFEILTHISGYYGTVMYMGPTVIKSITFHTNTRTHGPYGDEQGTPFSSNLKQGKIVGFHGRKGYFVDSIGVHVNEGNFWIPKRAGACSPPELPVAEMDNPQWSNKLVLAKRGQKEEATYGVVKEPAPCGPGPWGGDGGRPWDDGVFTGIKKIFLTKGEAICSIQIEYDRNGQSVWSTRHGGSGGDTTNRIKFDYPHEVITCISGYYGSISKDERPNVIRSLTFFTSRGKYGPYGEEIGTFFTSTITEGKVVGLHGRSSLYLDAIGIHMQHWLGHDDRRPPKSSVLSKFFY